MDLPTTIHAIERGRAPSSLPRNTRILQTAYFDLVISPPEPLYVGLRIEINTLRETENRGERGLGRNQKWYASAPADIMGVIVGIRTMELAVTELVVLNEVPQSQIKHAYLTVQHVEGVTMALTLWQRIARTILLPLLSHTRHVPIERNAVVVLEDEDED